MLEGNVVNQQLKRNIEEIIDRHTPEWKAGHNHLIVEQVLKAVEQHLKKQRRMMKRICAICLSKEHTTGKCPSK